MSKNSGNKWGKGLFTIPRNNRATKLRIGLILGLFLVGVYFVNDSRNPSGMLVTLFGGSIAPLNDSDNTNVSSTINNTSTSTEKANAGIVGTAISHTFVQTEALIASSIVQLTNMQRLQRGLPPVIINTALTLSAQKKVKDILANQYFEHISPSGIGVSDLAKQSGYDYVVVGENLALGSFPTNKSVVDAWMASTGHRSNILDARYQDIGIGIDRGMFQGSMQWVIVQHFGKPISACVQLDPKAKTKIENDKAYVLTLEAKINKLKGEIDATTGPAYQTKVAEYNAYVRDYNARIITLQTDIMKYNKTADDFNACIGTKVLN